MSSCSDSPAETVGVQRSSPHQVFIPRISRHQTLDGETLPGAARFLHRTITKTCLAKTEPAMVHRGGFPNPADIHYSGPCLVMCNVWQCNCVRCLHPCMVTSLLRIFHFFSKIIKLLVCGALGLTDEGGSLIFAVLFKSTSRASREGRPG